MVRKQIVYMPYIVRGSFSNSSVVKVIRFLNEIGVVKSELVMQYDYYNMLTTKAVVLNWTEEILSEQIKKRILAYKRCGVKIIYVLHNKLPHNLDNVDKVKDNMIWLADVADKIVLYSKSSVKYIPNPERNAYKGHFIPHPIFDVSSDKILENKLKEKYNLNEDSFTLLFFGFVKPYKNLEELILAFKNIDNKSIKLLIVGKSENKGYENKLKELSNGDSRIIFDFHFASDSELSSLIKVSDVVIAPYNNESCLNSGVIIHSFCCGRTVISTKFCMSDEYAELGIMETYSDSLDKVIREAYKKGKEYYNNMGQMAKEYILKNNNDDVVLDLWKNVIG